MNTINIVKTIKDETLKYRNNIAIKDGNITITYKELLFLVDLVSTELKKNGVSENDIVAVQYPDSYEYIIICLAVLSLNAVIAPAPLSMPKDELDELISKLNVSCLICNNESKTQISLPDPLSNMHIGIVLYTASKPEYYSELCSMNPAFIRFSSGTTGKSKGVLLSHQAVIERTDAANSALHITQEDTIIWLLNMSFHFVVTILLFLRKAATIVMSGRQFPLSLLEELKNNSGSFIYASPFHYKLMTDSDMFTPDLLRNIRLAISTAMKLSMPTADAFYKKFNLELSEAYGIIEVGLPFVHTPFNHDKRGSVGKKLSPYKVKILNPDTNKRGQICIKGPGFFNAYLNPFKTFKTLFHDGWFNTGDIGYLDDDNYLFIVGRKKDLINFAGMKIFPYAVEAVIQKCLSVKEVMIYGENHETFGEIPCAQIALHDGLQKDNELIAIKQYCYKHLSQYEVPKKFEFVNKIKKTPSGKIKR
jgi:long-chain acyl-CoA synthetase